MDKLIIALLIFLFILGCSLNKEKDSFNTREKIVSISNDDNISAISELGDNWFEVTGTSIIENITPEEAKNYAIEKACKKAVEYFSGVEIKGQIVDFQAESHKSILIDNFSSITTQTTRGVILKKEILSEKIITNGNQIIKVVNLKVKIGKQAGENDSSFQIESNLNRDYFKDGEKMILSFKSSKDCYITILNICSNDSVYVIFPNKYRKKNFVKSGETFLLPNSYDKEIGLYFPVKLLPNKNEDIEMIKVIATKQKIDFSSIYSFSAYGTYKTALTDLQRWVLEIPRSEIEEVDLQYFIGK